MIVLLKCFTVRAMSCSSAQCHRKKTRLKSPFPSSPSLPSLNSFDATQTSLCISFFFLFFFFFQINPPPTTVSNLESSYSCCHIFPSASRLSSQSNVAVFASDKLIKESGEKRGYNKWEKKVFLS